MYRNPGVWLGGTAWPSALPGKLRRFKQVLLFIAPGFSRPPMLLINTEIALFLGKKVEVRECSVVTKIGCCGRELQWCNKRDPAEETPADVELHASCPAPSSTAPRSGQDCRGHRELAGGSGGPAACGGGDSKLCAHSENSAGGSLCPVLI